MQSEGKELSKLDEVWNRETQQGDVDHRETHIMSNNVELSEDENDLKRAMRFLNLKDQQESRLRGGENNMDVTSDGRKTSTIDLQKGEIVDRLMFKPNTRRKSPIKTANEEKVHFGRAEEENTLEIADLADLDGIFKDDEKNNRVDGPNVNFVVQTPKERANQVESCFTFIKSAEYGFSLTLSHFSFCFAAKVTWRTAQGESCGQRCAERPAVKVSRRPESKARVW